MSWPAPEPGLVVRYAYPWRREQEAGREEGTKDRPCAVVLALAGEEGGRPRIVVLLITHSPPRVPGEAVELPAGTTRRLGLDDERSWVVVSEANRFLWPGPDLRFLPGSGPQSASYGVLPPDVFRAVRDRFLAGLRARRARSREQSLSEQAGLGAGDSGGLLGGGTWRRTGCGDPDAGAGHRPNGPRRSDRRGGSGGRGDGGAG